MQRRPQPVEETPAPGHVRWLAIVTAVVICSLWVMPLFSSLWLDELGTWWVVKDGLGDTVHRALTFHGQSPLYYLIVWSARVVGGHSEVVLRLPSLIAAAVSAVLLYRLGPDPDQPGGGPVDRPRVRGHADRSPSRRRRRGRTRSRPWRPSHPPTRSCDGSMTGVAGLARSCTPCSPSRWCGCTTSSRSSSWPTRCTRSSASDAERPRCPLADWPPSRVIVTAGIVPLAIQLASLWDRRSSLSIPSEGSVDGVRGRCCSPRCWSRPCSWGRSSRGCGPRSGRTGACAIVDPRAARHLAAVPRRHAVPRVDADARQLPVAPVLRVRVAGHRPVRGLGDRVAPARRGATYRRVRPGDPERPGVRRHVEERRGLAGRRRVRARARRPRHDRPVAPRARGVGAAGLVLRSGEAQLPPVGAVLLPDGRPTYCRCRTSSTTRRATTSRVS